MTSAAALSTLHLCSAPTSSDRSSFGGGSRGALPGDCGDTPTSGQEHDEPPAAAADALVGCCASWGGGAAPAAGCWEAWPALFGPPPPPACAGAGGGLVPCSIDLVHPSGPGGRVRGRAALDVRPQSPPAGTPPP
eukprot:CAMPEP_0114164196 /NCGR_PEP_ID=MMETSP0043_2-20121206/30507_1 /TAXON_ID=464988 /ORGANISM="Hemiselmis andersenii, Strain CCMP644" /LENGTH=134 /DNA_ID=CAMNT_0001260777 /DNA_START=40 /DNA_END=442 /DNA_ORIENTATION=+